MRTVTKRQKLGALLCLGTVLLTSGCRKDTAPVIEICIADGMGGMDCSEKDGSRKYLLPSQSKNYWCTNQSDQSQFASWCYKTSVGNIQQAMDSKEAEIKGYPVEVVSP